VRSICLVPLAQFLFGEKHNDHDQIFVVFGDQHVAARRNGSVGRMFAAGKQNYHK